MDLIRIHGGRPLKGAVHVSGSKNAALPILVASLLTDKLCRFSRVPMLKDIDSTVTLLRHMGVTAQGDAPNCELQASEVKTEAPYDLVRKMRASVLVLGPLLARFGRAKVSLPGGCAIGARPINYHLSVLEKLGAQIDLEQGYVVAKSRRGRLQGAKYRFDFPSVGATENALMAAVLAQGESEFQNCAREPEVVDLARMLTGMGAKIEGAGTDRLLVQGVDRLDGVDHAIMGDRIEAATFLSAGLITGGQVRVEGLAPEHLEACLLKFEEAGAHLERGETSIELVSEGRPRATDLRTETFPGFPTDMQAQFMAVMCTAAGVSTIVETIFENRFMHVAELERMGARVKLAGRTAVVTGIERFRGAPVMATDLRASASLILAGLQAEGETLVSRVYHLDRGYDRIEEKLRGLGAEISREQT